MVKPSIDKTLDQVLNDIEKQFGKGAIMKLGDHEKREIDVGKDILDCIFEPEEKNELTLKTKSGVDIDFIIADIMFNVNNNNIEKEILSIHCALALKEEINTIFIFKVVTENDKSFIVQEQDENIAKAVFEEFKKRVAECD